MTGVTSVGQDAMFGSNLCWVWWPEKASNLCYAADCLDGKTGLRINYQESVDTCDSQEAIATPAFSACSTFAMVLLNMEILQNIGVPNMVPGKDQSKLSISELRQLKHKVSAQYESAKADLFRHRVFDQWSCRVCE